MFDYTLIDELRTAVITYLLIGVLVGVIITAICEPFPSRHQRILSNIVFTIAWPVAIAGGILSFIAYSIRESTASTQKPSDDSDEDLQERRRQIAERGAKAVAAARKKT